MTIARRTLFLILALAATLAAAPAPPSMERLFSMSSHILEVEVTLLSEQRQGLDPFESDRAKSGILRRYRLDVKRIWKETGGTPKSFEMTLFEESPPVRSRFSDPKSLSTGPLILALVRKENGSWSFAYRSHSVFPADQRTREGLDRKKAFPPPPSEVKVR